MRWLDREIAWVSAVMECEWPNLHTSFSLKLLDFNHETAITFTARFSRNANRNANSIARPAIALSTSIERFSNLSNLKTHKIGLAFRITDDILDS
jgi:hypothetical protein